MRAALAYRPSRGPLQSAGPGAAAAFLGGFAVVGFAYSDPFVLLGAGLAVTVAGLIAGARVALVAAARWGVTLGLLIVAVNAVVTDRGLTVLVRGFDAPVVGHIDITLESIAAGSVIALRVLVVMLAFAVYSACVDPDRVLAGLRPFAARSALTATLVARLVPLAARDSARLKEAGSLRGPGAAPIGRAAMARRLVAGSLDRAVDAAATLELRGYGAAESVRGRPRRKRSRYNRRFLACGLVVAIGGLALRIAGVGGFGAYPEVHLDADAATIAFALLLPLFGALPFARRPLPRTARLTPEASRV